MGGWAGGGVQSQNPARSGVGESEWVALEGEPRQGSWGPKGASCLEREGQAGPKLTAGPPGDPATQKLTHSASACPWGPGLCTEPQWEAEVRSRPRGGPGPSSLSRK